MGINRLGGDTMGIDSPTPDTGRLAEIERQIEGRWALINRLFDDVEQLVEERDRLAGRSYGLLDRLFGRRLHAPAPAGMTRVRRTPTLGDYPVTPLRHDQEMRAAS